MESTHLEEPKERLRRLNREAAESRRIEIEQTTGPVEIVTEASVALREDSLAALGEAALQAVLEA